jgi:hypothetical protein
VFLSISAAKTKAKCPQHDMEAMTALNVQPTLLQNVFLWIARCPSSSYSLFDTHIFLKVSSDARIEPPIQVEYKRSWGADICNNNIITRLRNMLLKTYFQTM